MSFVTTMPPTETMTKRSATQLIVAWKKPCPSQFARAGAREGSAGLAGEPRSCSFSCKVELGIAGQSILPQLVVERHPTDPQLGGGAQAIVAVPLQRFGDASGLGRSACPAQVAG